MWAVWTVLALVALSQVVVIGYGLVGHHDAPKTYGARDVLFACLLLALTGWAAHAVWGR